jgi:hypothetical protein
MMVIAFSALIGLAYFVWTSNAPNRHVSADDPLSSWPQQSRLK